MPKTLASLALAATIAAGAPAQGGSTPIPCRFTPYGSSCGPELTGSDVVRNGVHQLELTIRKAAPNGSATLLLGGQKTSLWLPVLACPLRVEPLVAVPLRTGPSGEATLRLNVPGELKGTVYGQGLGRLTIQNIGATAGMDVQCRGTLVVSGVTPLSGREGTLFTIVGRNFGNDPASYCVLVGGMTTGAAVVRASPTQLVARIGPVPKVAQGDVRLAGGLRTKLPRGAMTLGGQQVVVDAATMFDVTHEVAAGVQFKLSSASPLTTAATMRGDEVVFTWPSTSTLIQRISLHGWSWGVFRCFEIGWGISTPGGFTANTGPSVLAEYVNLHVPGVSAKVQGNTVVVDPGAGPLQRAAGYLRVQ